MSSRNRPECVVPECYAPGVHLPECEDYTKCDGCAPGLAAAGLLTCRHHRDQLVRSVERLPRLHAELQDALAPYRSPQAPKGDGGRSADTPDVIDAVVFEHRAAIFEWLDLFAAQAVRIRTRKQADAAAANPKRPALPPITGPRRDVPAMARYVGLHADALCSDELTAPRAAPRFDRIVREARHVLSRSRAAGVYLGACPMPVAHNGTTEPCGGPIRYERPDKVADDDTAWQVECPWCHKVETLEWWRQRIAGDLAEESLLTGAQLATRLSVKLSVPITDSLLRKWRHAGRVDSVAWCQVDGDKRPRVLYVAESVEAHARKVYGVQSAEPDVDAEQAAS
jgi:hypothetical protein